MQSEEDHDCRSKEDEKSVSTGGATSKRSRGGQGTIEGEVETGIADVQGEEGR